MMRIWGVLSADDEKNGFDLVLDESWYVLLLDRGKVIARFDPRDYTASELQKEVEMVLRTKRGGPMAG
jgi:hypothetical protein